MYIPSILNWCLTMYTKYLKWYLTKFTKYLNWRFKMYTKYLNWCLTMSFKFFPMTIEMKPLCPSFEGFFFLTFSLHENCVQTIKSFSWRKKKILSDIESRRKLSSSFHFCISTLREKTAKNVELLAPFFWDTRTTQNSRHVFRLNFRKKSLFKVKKNWSRSSSRFRRSNHFHVHVNNL